MHKPPGPDYMQVISKDCAGKVTSREWVKKTEPHHYPSHGIAEVPRYIAQFFASDSPFLGLSFFRTRGWGSAGLCKQDGELSILLHFEQGQDPADEARARKFFEGLGSTTMHDYSVPGDQGRSIRWRVAGEIDQITVLYQQILSELVHITDDEPLDVLYTNGEKERIPIPLENERP